MVDKAEISKAKRVIKRALELDQNEADTRRGIERVLEAVCGLDPLENLSREHAVRGAGETEYVDFTLNIKGEIVMMIEVKRVGLNLAQKHLNQLSKYTIDKGCNWALLTNGKQWRLHGVSYGQPPQLTEILSWDLLEDKPARVVECMEYLTLRSLRKNDIEKLWQRRLATLPANTLTALMSQTVLNALRREIKKNTKSTVEHKDVVNGVRQLLNESNLTRLDELGLPKQQPARSQRKPTAKPLEVSAPPTATAENPMAAQEPEPRPSYLSPFGGQPSSEEQSD